MIIPETILVRHLRSLDDVEHDSVRKSKVENGQKNDGVGNYAQYTGMLPNLAVRAACHLRVIKIRVHHCVVIEEPGLDECDCKQSGKFC
jgi:hypothetical protein